MYMEILAVTKIWDYVGKRLRMRVRTVEDTGQNVQNRDVTYWYQVYDRQAKIQEETIRSSSVDLRV